MPKFAVLMDELKDMGFASENGRVSLGDKSNGKSTKAPDPEPADEELEEEDEYEAAPEDDQEPEVSVEPSPDLSRVLERLSMLAAGLSEGFSKFGEALDQFRVLVESAQEEDEDQGEDDGEIPEPEPG